LHPLSLLSLSPVKCSAAQGCTKYKCSQLHVCHSATKKMLTTYIVTIWQTFLGCVIANEFLSLSYFCFYPEIIYEKYSTNTAYAKNHYELWFFFLYISMWRHLPQALTVSFCAPSRTCLLPAPFHFGKVTEGQGHLVLLKTVFKHLKPPSFCNPFFDQNRTFHLQRAEFTVIVVLFAKRTTCKLQRRYAASISLGHDSRRGNIHGTFQL